MTELKVAFAGLGAMGHPMAGHLARAGLLAAVWNRTHAKAEAVAAEWKVAAPATVAEFARDRDLIALCVPADADVLALAREIAEHAKPGTIVVDHSTVSSVTARAAADLLAAPHLELLELQGAVVERRRQPEAVLDERLLARDVPVVHPAQLWQRLVALVDDDQVVRRQIVHQRRRRLAG